MKAITRTLIITLAIVATILVTWAIQFLGINPTCFEHLLHIATITSVIAIAEQYRKLKNKEIMINIEAIPTEQFLLAKRGLRDAWYPSKHTTQPHSYRTYPRKSQQANREKDLLRQRVNQVHSIQALSTMTLWYTKELKFPTISRTRWLTT